MKITMTKQPVWQYLGNYGDATPLLHGGYFVYSDKTGVYGVEAVLFEPIGDEDTCKPEKFEIRRFSCPRCTFINGILSDNKFHPDKPAWFADKIEEMANHFDYCVDNFTQLFTSADPINLAYAWRMVGEYFGFDNLDEYPLVLTRREVYNKYRVECYH